MAEARRIAVVTGSSSGIGAAIARALAEDGLTVVVNSSSSVAAGEELAGEIGGAYEQADVSDREQAGGLIERAVERFGRLDLLVNNAATTVTIPHRDLDAVTAEIWAKILDTNLLGAWWTTAAAVPHLRSAEDGQVINITSTSASRPAGSSIPYAVAKAGLDHMTRLLAKALGPEVRVNAVAPGLVDTPWSADWEEVKEQVAGSVAMRRVGQPEDIAAACRLVIGTPYMTGAVVNVDGGLSLL